MYIEENINGNIDIKDRAMLARANLRLLDQWSVNDKDKIKIHRIGAQWMRRPHRRFHRRTLFATIIEDGIVGLISVHAELDCTYSWDLTGSRP